MIINLYSKKCFLSFIYHISYFLLEKLHFSLYILRKKKYWLNFGFFIPQAVNLSFYNILHRDLLFLNMEIPEQLSSESLRSNIGKKYFKFFFSFIFGILLFSKYFISYFNQLTNIMKIRLKNRLIYRKRSKYFLRFFQFCRFDLELKNIQKMFNYMISEKLSRTLVLNKKLCHN